jgi:hypothetical protein
MVEISGFALKKNFRGLLRLLKKTIDFHRLTRIQAFTIKTMIFGAMKKITIVGK